MITSKEIQLFFSPKLLKSVKIQPHPTQARIFALSQSKTIITMAQAKKNIPAARLKEMLAKSRNIEEAVGSRGFLGSWDFIAPDGSAYLEKTFTVDRVDAEDVFNPLNSKEEGCVVLYFKEKREDGTDYKMILKATNRKMASRVIGAAKGYKVPSTNHHEWSGAKLVLSVEVILLKQTKEEVPAVRILNKLAAKAAKPVLNEQHKDWKKFVRALAFGQTTIEQARVKSDISDKDAELAVEQATELMNTQNEQA